MSRRAVDPAGEARRESVAELAVEIEASERQVASASKQLETLVERLKARETRTDR